MKIIKKSYTIHTSASWTEFKIDSYEYMNNPWWKQYYIQAWIHWTEIIWIPIIYEIIEYLKNNNPIINIICVPIANPFWLDSQIMWIQTWYNNIHTNFQNCYNYNRLWTWISSKFENNIIFTLLKISKNCDIIIDIHSAWYESCEHIYSHYKNISNANKFNFENIISWDNIPWDSFEEINIKMKKEAYTLELWASRTVDKIRINKYFNNILIFLWLEQNYKKTENIIWNLGDFENIYSSFWWILVWEKRVWDYIKKWEIIAKVYTTYGKENIISKNNYYFLIKNPIHSTYSWQEIAQFLVKI